MVGKLADPIGSQALEILDAARETSARVSALQAGDRRSYISAAANALEEFNAQQAKLADLGSPRRAAPSRRSRTRGAVKYEAIVKPREPLPEAALFQGCGGGTSIEAVLTRALKVIETHPGALRKSDVVLVTDGASDASSAPDLRQAAEQLNVSVLAIGVSAEALTPWCSEVHTVDDLTSVDQPIATSLFAA